MKIRDLSVDEFKTLIQEVVEDKLEEMLGDPDEGLGLQEKVKERLQHSVAAETMGIPAEKVAREMGLEW